MSRIGVRLVYFVRTALSGLRQSPLTTGIAVITIGVALVLVGAFALLLANMEELLARFGDDLQVTVYLEDALAPEKVDELLRIARTVEGVESARVVTPAEALERFRAGVGRGSALLEGLEENPLPASLELTLAPASRSAQGMARAVGALEGIPGVAELASGQDWVEGYLRAIALLRGIAWGLGVLLALATLLIVANTIRLAIYARRDELEILALVGASRVFVSTPFLLEGLLQGALAGGLALLLLLALFRLVLPGFEFGLALLLGGVSPRFFAPHEMAALLAAGAALGLIGSAAALAGRSRA
jgi:cell division transport system permease protein